MPESGPGPGEVAIRVHASGVNPSDTKRRGGWLGLGMPHPRVIPHSDGAGVIEAVGDGVPASRLGERVWVWNAQGGERPFGTAAERVTVPSEQAVPLPDEAGFGVGACLGVPGCTAHPRGLRRWPGRRADDPRAGRRRRGRSPRHPAGNARGRAGHRDGEHTGEGRDRARGRRGSRPSSIPRKRSPVGWTN